MDSLSRSTIKSSALKFYFKANQLDFQNPFIPPSLVRVSILSVFNGKLLIGRKQHDQLSIYNTDGSFLSNITPKSGILDATWTSTGNIVCTDYFTEISLISQSGEILALTKMAQPKCLSLSLDNTIYLADYKSGIHQSSDGGVTWNFVFKPIDEWKCYQVIKVANDDSDDFWTLEDKGEVRRIRVYSMDKNHSDDSFKWSDISLPIKNGKYIALNDCYLAYDGSKNIFLNDRMHDVIHVLSVNGQYHYPLLSREDINNRPLRLTVDNENRRLYIGQYRNLVHVFELTYE